MACSLRIVNRIGLVASTNGLGHARRLAYLGLAFTDLGFNTTLFASRRQIDLLKSELIGLMQSAALNFIEIGYHGIDGPVWSQTIGKIEEPEQDVVAKIKNCELLISDNLIWPIKYNPSFVLFGHFNWLNYWSQMGMSNFSSKAIDIFSEESHLFEKIQLAFQFKDFTVNSGHYTVNRTIQIKLLRYLTDSQFPKSTGKTHVAWVASGTTGLHKKLMSSKHIQENIEFLEMETYQLIQSKIKPSFVLGRPGLGTIRDCLASGTPFLPYFGNLDIELSSNVNRLKQMSLYSGISSVDSDIETDIFSLLQNTPLQDLWSSIWPKISEKTTLIAESILANTEHLV